jgi:hypothetical protein
MVKRLCAPVTACLLLLASLPACSPPLTVEQQIIAVIREMEARIEDGERRPFMEHIAPEFAGQDGIIDRDRLNAMVLYQLHRNQRLHAQLFPVNVVERGPEIAEAGFRVLVTGGPGWIPERGQVYQIETRWHRRNDEWLLVRASWKPVQVEDMVPIGR